MSITPEQRLRFAIRDVKEAIDLIYEKEPASNALLSLDKLWKEYNRVCKKNAAIILTAAQPFTSNLVMSNPKYFKYNLSRIK